MKTSPISHALARVMLGRKDGDVGIILRDLDQCPENPEGFGDGHWKDHGMEIGDSKGAGANKGFLREPLPVSLRPRDPFL